MTTLRTFITRPLLLLATLVSAAGGALAGPALDALDGRWAITQCDDPSTGTWSVIGNQIQFFWPTDRASDALEVVTREEADTVETEVIAPDGLKGRRFRYSIVGDQVLIEDLDQRTQQVVRRCGR